MNRPHLPDLRGVLHRHRRILAALCAFAAVLAALSVLRPADTDRVPLVAAASDLAPGTVLSRAHLVVLAVPPEAVPAGAFTDAAAVEGRALGVPLTARSPVTTAGLESGAKLAGPGLVVVALPLPGDGVAALIRPGTRLDVLDATGATVAQNIRVLQAPDPPSGGLGLGGSSRAALIEVEPAVAAKLAAVRDAGAWTIAVH